MINVKVYKDSQIKNSKQNINANHPHLFVNKKEPTLNR